MSAATKRLQRAVASLEAAARAFARDETEWNSTALKEAAGELVRAEAFLNAEHSLGKPLPYEPPDPKLLTEVERRLSQQGKKLEATLHYRQRLGTTVEEAQAAVDAWMREVRLGELP